MIIPQGSEEKRQPKYGSDLMVDLMAALDIEYAAFNPGATFRGIHDSLVNYAGNVKPRVIFFHNKGLKRYPTIRSRILRVT